MLTTPSNLHALLGCLVGYVLAALIAASAPLDELSVALVTAFLPPACRGVDRVLWKYHLPHWRGRVRSLS